MKQLLLILALGASLAGALNLSGTVDDDATATPETTTTTTPAPDCAPPEFHDPWLDRCRLPDTPEPSETPAWPPEVQATMDANPYDNDYQYIDWCFEYVDGGTHIVYYPCQATPGPGQ